MEVFMKSLKNHLSLIVALFSILFTLQIFFIVDRAIISYEEGLKNDYSIIVIAKTSIATEKFLTMSKIIEDAEEISPEKVIERLKDDIKTKNLSLLRLALPKFYRLHLEHFPKPYEIEKLTKVLLKKPNITRVESFTKNHDTIYKLLLLFKGVIQVFSLAVFVVTSLLIFKEMRIWQFQHSERMSIMALFGAPVWLRSAVLFRLAIVDALVASVILMITFVILNTNTFIKFELGNIGIDIVLFDIVNDGLLLTGVALLLSLILATLLVIGHKEEA